MKNQAFCRRLSFAVNGWKDAFSKESSFRQQTLAGCGALLATSFIQPSLVWWALVCIMIALVLAAELINTALERTLDGLHPGQADFVKLAKDCAAGAVLILSFTSVVVFLLMWADCVL